MHSDKKPKFPLPRGYFGDVHFSKEQEQYYGEFCRQQVQRGLQDERAFERCDRQIDLKKWKPVRSQHTFQLFRRRDAGLYEKDGKPSMIGIGRVEGSIEDVLYGAYDQTDEELRMTAELVEVDFGDGIVLNNMEQGSPSDPYRYLGIKWILTPFPMPALMPDRDWILLESMGIAKDSNGRRYGYHTLFTVELPHCPVFPEVIRGTMWYTFIYRDAGPGMIDVHSQGYFDCLGELMDPLTIIGSTQMFNGVFRYMKSAEAKKLTILALENLERNVSMGLPPTTDKSTIAPTATCSICTKHRSSIPFSSRRMRICRVCDAVVCMNCRVKKNILVGRQRVQAKVSVCQKCIAHAKTLIVNPADEKYVISREMQMNDRGHGNSNASAAFHTTTGRQQYYASLMPRPQGRPAGFSYDAEDTEVTTYETTQQVPVANRVARARSRETVLLQEQPPSDRRPSHPSTEAPSNPTPRTRSVGDQPEDSAKHQALMQRMMELQMSAKRAHDLTEASRVAMVENKAGP